jgi:hypothetical protein
MSEWAAWNESAIWSLSLIAITITIHAIGVVVIAAVAQHFSIEVVGRRYPFVGTHPGSVVTIVTVAMSLVVLHALECLLWAAAYVHLGALPNPAAAELYSVDSMTTRGASGFFLEKQWRMMGAAEAGDGMLLFGISTAFVFYLMHRIWRDDNVRGDGGGANG